MFKSKGFAKCVVVLGLLTALTARPGVANADGKLTILTSGEFVTIDRQSNEYSKFALKRVEPDVGDRRDLPWMSGQVCIEIVVDENGRVAEARALIGHSSLIDSGVQAALRWEFRPFVVNGVSRRVRSAIKFDVTPFSEELRNGNYVAAVDRELKARPDSHLAYFNAGFAYDTFGNRHREAIDFYRRAIELKPDWSLAWYGLGHAHYGLDQYEEALGAYQRAVGLDSTLYEAAFEIGWCLDRLSPAVDSGPAFERAASMAKSAEGRLEALQNLTASHARAGRMRDSADARFRKVLEMRRFVGIDPNNFYNVPREAFDVAKNYEAIGETGRMAEAFQLAMETDETSYFGMQSRMELAEHMEATGNEAEARRLFESALALVTASERGSNAARDRETRAVRRYWSGWALLELGRPKEALAEAKRAVALLPDWDRARLMLGRAYERLGDKEKAAAEMRRSGLVDESEIRRRLG